MNIYYWLTFSTIGIHEIIRNFYPELYVSTCFTLSYNSIYLFSAYQQWSNNLYNTYCLPYYLNITTNTEFIQWKKYLFPTECILFIQNGNIITRSTKHLCNNIENYYIEYDYIIDDETIDKKIYTKIPKEFENVEVSTVKFILVEFMIGHELLKIQFTTDYYNYAVVNNRINKQFLIYFLRKHYLNNIFHDIHNIDLHNNLDKYLLKIIDSDVNIITITDEDTIVFTKDSFIIERETKDDINKKEKQKGKELEDEKLEDDETVLVELEKKQNFWYNIFIRSS